MNASPLSVKGQVTIPKAIRDHLGLEAGNTVEFVVTPEGDVVVRKRYDTARPLRGALQRFASEQALSVEEMEAAVAREATRRDRASRTGDA